MSVIAADARTRALPCLLPVLLTMKSRFELFDTLLCCAFST